MRYTIKTSGLMCGHCDATVETALLNVAGVTDADADHETQTVQVECADTVTAEQLAAAVEGAGEKFHALSVTAEQLAAAVEAAGEKFHALSVTAA